MHTPSVVVILSERSESKDLRTDLTANVAVSVKILRLRASPSAQDDTLQRHSGNLQISIYQTGHDTGRTVMRDDIGHVGARLSAATGRQISICQAGYDTGRTVMRDDLQEG